MLKKKKKKKRQRRERKSKDNREGKEDHDSTMNATPEKVLIKGDVMKKHTLPSFPQALHGKKGTRNA